MSCKRSFSGKIGYSELWYGNIIPQDDDFLTIPTYEETLTDKQTEFLDKMIDNRVELDILMNLWSLSIASNWVRKDG